VLATFVDDAFRLLRIDRHSAPLARLPKPSWWKGMRTGVPLQMQQLMSGIGTKIRWEHTHQRRKCGHVIPIDDIYPRVITTAVITCPKCETSGPINVAIVQTNP
jgi:hypothetical protein